MPQTAHNRTAEDVARLVSYVVGVAWAVLFIVFTPTLYSGVIDPVFTKGWAALALIGCLLASFGSFTRRDTKLELAGLYLVQLGVLIYAVAQAGFFGVHTGALGPFDRVAISAFIIWHITLMLPRIVGLELYRRSVHRVAATRTEDGGQK